ncbi:MAG: carboxypeptidase-like regulatory domain-containing protein [Acidobacteriota bacterium]
MRPLAIQNTPLAIRAAAAAAILLLLYALTAAAPRAEAQPKDGETVRLFGQVLDGDGEPVPEVTVILEASRKRFSLRHFEERQSEPLKMPASTDARGRFQFDWIWDPHFNVFELAVGLEVSRGGKPGFEIFTRQDVSGELAGGAPPEILVRLEDVSWIRWLKVLIGGNASDAEKNTYRDLGRPDKLTLDGTTSAWWYFELGKVYRFDGGRLDQVIEFEPVKDSTEDP